jgi:hypothetical protein
MRLDIKVTPRASRAGVEWRDGQLVVRVTAPPVEGAANEAVRETLAEALDVPRRTVQIVAGQSGRRKIVEISEITDAELQRRLAGVKRR